MVCAVFRPGLSFVLCAHESLFVQCGGEQRGCFAAKMFSSIKERIHHANLYAPVVVAVFAVGGFFKTVKSLDPDAQALA